MKMSRKLTPPVQDCTQIPLYAVGTLDEMEF